MTTPEARFVRKLPKFWSALAGRGLTVPLTYFTTVESVRDRESWEKPCQEYYIEKWLEFVEHNGRRSLSSARKGNEWTKHYRSTYLDKLQDAVDSGLLIDLSRINPDFRRVMFDPNELLYESESFQTYGEFYPKRKLILETAVREKEYILSTSNLNRSKPSILDNSCLIQVLTDCLGSIGLRSRNRKTTSTRAVFDIELPDNRRLVCGSELDAQWEIFEMNGWDFFLSIESRGKVPTPRLRSSDNPYLLVAPFELAPHFVEYQGRGEKWSDIIFGAISFTLFVDAFLEVFLDNADAD